MKICIDRMNDQKGKDEYWMYACNTFLLVPKLKVIDWLEEPVKKLGIPREYLERGFDENAKKVNSLAVITPVLKDADEIKGFLEKKAEMLTEYLLKAWGIAETEWPEKREIGHLADKYDIEYEGIVCGFSEEGKKWDASEKRHYKVLRVEGKKKFVEWCGSLKAKGGMPMMGDNRRSLSFLCHSTEDIDATGWEDQVKENYIDIAQFMMKMGSEDKSKWPKDRSYLKLGEWFDVKVYPRTLDLMTK